MVTHLSILTWSWHPILRLIYVLTSLSTFFPPEYNFLQQSLPLTILFPIHVLPYIFFLVLLRTCFLLRVFPSTYISSLKNFSHRSVISVRVFVAAKQKQFAEIFYWCSYCESIFCRNIYWEENFHFSAVATTINMLLRVFPKRENIHSVILVCVVTLVNMNYIWRMI